MSAYNINIFLPAAGLGERLRPITNHLPKPLLPILGKPIIEGILEKLTGVCDGGIGINLHYKPELIRSWAATSRWTDRIQFFPEDPILGTGGALKNAAAFLSSGPFIVHNSDILLNIDFSRLIEEHLASGNIATLACHHLPHLSNVVIDKHGQVLDVENPGDSRPDPQTTADKVAYTGIAVYSPDILHFLPMGVSHATVAWIAASKAGRRVRSFDVTGAYWNDVGNPVTYARGVMDALLKQGETVFISQASKCGQISADGYTIIESGSEVGDTARIRNCIVMPGSRVSGSHTDCILGPDYTITLSESDMQPSLNAAEKKRVSLSDPLFARHFGISAVREDTPLTPDSPFWSDAILIGLGGSDRRYFRVRNNGKTAVLMECAAEDPDYGRHLVYTRFFEAHEVPVPGLLASENAKKRALFEDLGDTSLYSYLKVPRNSAQVEELYRGVLDILVKLHSRVTEHVHECPPLRDRIFDYDYLRWETSYFVDKFVLGVNKLSEGAMPALKNDFHQLARVVDACPKTVMHRDFQCQNIMITADAIPRVIDFQGARMGAPAYDLASILWDPYYRLDEPMRERLIGYYLAELKNMLPAFSEQSLLNSLIPCRLQRHMQALGAYGFLSEVKGKHYFLKHIPDALRLLREETETAKADYPELYRLVHSLK